MKTCSICNQTYTDENLNFCLNDGGVLIAAKDDAPPTIQMNRVRTTQPNWAEHEPSSPWGSQPLQTQQQQNQPTYQMTGMPPPAGQNQVLPTISLVLGILGVLLFCCWGGFPFGLAAIVTGYLGYQNAEKNSEQYGGRGMAIAGMVLGIIGFLGVIMLFLFSVAGNLFK